MAEKDQKYKIFDDLYPLICNEITFALKTVEKARDWISQTILPTEKEKRQRWETVAERDFYLKYRNEISTISGDDPPSVHCYHRRPHEPPEPLPSSPTPPPPVPKFLSRSRRLSNSRCAFSFSLFVSCDGSWGG